jgi:DNA-binding transcriptional LysR family regulator
MKLRHLEYFVAAAEELNFTRAAGRLHVPQTAFSKQIQDLEGELGVNLFQRERKGVALTAAGKAFLIDARGILEACDLASDNSWAESGRTSQRTNSLAKWVLSNHFFGFGIKQRDLFEVELDGDLFTQMK